MRQQLDYDCVPKQDIEDLAAKYDLKYFEASAKKNLNVNSCFEHLASQIKNHYQFEVESARNLVLHMRGKETKKRKRDCC